MLESNTWILAKKNWYYMKTASLKERAFRLSYITTKSVISLIILTRSHQAVPIKPISFQQKTPYSSLNLIRYSTRIKLLFQLPRRQTESHIFSLHSGKPVTFRHSGLCKGDAQDEIVIGSKKVTDRFSIDP